MSMSIMFHITGFMLTFAIWINYNNYIKTNDMIWYYLTIICGIVALACFIVGYIIRDKQVYKITGRSSE